VVDLSSLAPAQMASMLGKPEGEVGRAVGEMLNRINANITSAVYQRLMLRDHDRILEIGFGNGRLLPALMALADDMTYVGLDRAETMVTEATAHNAELVAAARASFCLGSAESIPCKDESFDRVFAVNVIYFWPEPVRALAEMRRVLRPGGLSIVASIVMAPGEDPPPFAKSEYGFHRRSREALLALHRDAGFADVVVDDYSETAPLPDGSTRKRSYAIILARP
jgi:ubiquinone/menaquinone biosynthesis C-methylase UbiE